MCRFPSNFFFVFTSNLIPIHMCRYWSVIFQQGWMIWGNWLIRILFPPILHLLLIVISEDKFLILSIFNNGMQKCFSNMTKTISDKYWNKTVFCSFMYRSQYVLMKLHASWCMFTFHITHHKPSCYFCFSIIEKFILDFSLFGCPMVYSNVTTVLQPWASPLSSQPHPHQKSVCKWCFNFT